MGSERSSLSNCARPGNGGQEEGKVGAGGGPQICTGILIVLSTSDEGDGSKWPEPPSGSGCAMIYESQAHIRFQCKIFKINKCLIQNYIYSEGSLKTPSSESPIMRNGLLWSCRLIFKRISSTLLGRDEICSPSQHRARHFHARRRPRLDAAS